MSKQTETPTSSSNGPMMVMVAGAVVVVALVAWALTRSVEPAPPAPADTIAVAPAPSTVPPAGTTASTSTLSPGAFSIPQDGHPQDPDKAVVPRISAEDLHAKFERGAVTIIDVRDQSAFEGGHIPGSLHIAMASIQSQLASIPKEKPIVAYCT